MGASVINATGTVIYGTVPQIMELLGRLQAASVVNLQGVSFVVLAEPVTEKQLPAPATAKRRRV